MTQKPVSALLAAVLLLPGLVLAQQSTSDAIAVAANGKTASAAVSSQAGRSPFFLLFDKQGRFVEAVSNPYKDSGNAGIPALDFLAGKGVKVVVAEGFGSKIVEEMKSRGMRPVEFRGNATGAVTKALGPKSK
jgi:predicted Fe-Mo cluster-binding NifX family protein